MQMSPEMRAALNAPHVTMFVAVQVQVFDKYLRLIDGASEVTFADRTFKGLDPEFGVLASLEPLSDGMGDNAPKVRIGINPPTPDAAATLAAAQLQGAQVIIWLGAYDPRAGAVVADPIVVFVGDVDQGILRVGRSSRMVSLECVSIWERLFDDNEGVRLTNSYHQSAWPGELGLEYVTAVRRQLPWGADAPRPDVVKDARDGVHS